MRPVRNLSASRLSRSSNDRPELAAKTGATNLSTSCRPGMAGYRHGKQHRTQAIQYCTGSNSTQCRQGEVKEGVRATRAQLVGLALVASLQRSTGIDDTDRRD